MQKLLVVVFAFVLNLPTAMAQTKFELGTEMYKSEDMHPEKYIGKDENSFY